MSLESLLRARLTDSRAMTATLDMNNKRVLLKFGEIAGLPGIVIKVVGDEIRVDGPEDIAKAWRAAEAERLSAVQTAEPAADPGKIELVYVGGKLFAGEGGEEVELPDALLADLLDAAKEEAAKTKAPDPAGSGDGEGDGPKAIVHTEHSKDDLVAIAKAEGAEYVANATKEQIAAAINANRGL